MTGNGEMGKFPLNPKKEGIIGAFDVFVQLDNVSVVAGEEFGDGVDEANLIRAADQKDGGGFAHGEGVEIE